MEFGGARPTQPASATPENLHHKPRPRSPGSSSAVAEARFRENLLEGFPELGVEDGVDDWVEEGVDVAQPDEEGEQHLEPCVLISCVSINPGFSFFVSVPHTATSCI